MSEVEEILEVLESDDPGPGIERARELLDDPELGPEDDSRLRYGIAAGMFKLANYEGALQWLEQTDDPRRFIFQGFCYLELDRFTNAGEALQQAAEAEPDRKHEAKLMQAQSLVLADRLDRAKTLYESLVEENNLSENITMECRLGLAVTCMETENYSRAQELLEWVLNREEDSDYHPQALFYIVEVHEKLGQVEQAITRAQELKQWEDDSMWEDVAGRFLQRLHDQKKNRDSRLRDYEF